jgi:hypothetical protein
VTVGELSESTSYRFHTNERIDRSKCASAFAAFDSDDMTVSSPAGSLTRAGPVAASAAEPAWRSYSLTKPSA